MSKLRVCHFLNFAKDGGAVDSISAMIPYSKHTHTYVTFKASDRRRKQFSDAGIRLVELDKDDVHFTGEEQILAAIDYMSHNADIVHARNCGGPEPGVKIGIEADKPVVLAIGAPIPYPRKEQEQGNVTVVPISQGLTEAWRNESNEYDVEFYVNYSCANPITKQTKSVSQKYFGLDPDKLTVGRLGRLEGLKRPHDFIRAAELIYQQRQDVQFLLIGGGRDEKGVEGEANLIMERNEGMRIHMPGFVTGAMKDLAYSAMDVFLYPTSAEAFGSVFAEAMSAGLPIVTYSDAVNIDVVGSAGMFVVDNVYAEGVDDPFRSLASITLDLLANPRERTKLAVRGIQRYHERYRPEINAKNYDAIYERIING